MVNKLISVVIPTFNRKELTDRAIQSVVTSFPELLEIIVVDDCGSIPYFYDEAVNASSVPVRVARLAVNVGAGMARKAGVGSANGEYIAFLDSDDSYDKAWMDYVIAELRTNPQAGNCHLMISGITKGARPAGAVVRNLLATMPASLQLAASRVVATLFNPFYTPSIVLHKDLCDFKDGLRYCEDYFSNAAALFKADKIFLPKVVACHLGREPNSAGGQSGARAKMYSGEMEVRYAMFGFPFMPVRYKLLVPFGLMYQVLRTALKRIYALRCRFHA